MFATQCLKKRKNVDQRLREHIKSMRDFVLTLESLIGRLEVPTYAAWKAANKKADAEWKAANKKLLQRSRLKHTPRRERLRSRPID